MWEGTTGEHPPDICASDCSDEWSCAKTELAKRDAARRTAPNEPLLDGETSDKRKRIDAED